MLPEDGLTGLDLFSKVQGGHNYNCIVFYETGYKLNDMRQAARRAWRIGQPRDCYIYYLYYKGTMQHRAMSLMSKKMAAALALEGEFSEDGLAAMAGEDNMQMAMAKSMSEAIDDADMQRSWSKVKSRGREEEADQEEVIPTLADLAADAKPDALDTLEAEAQLLARTILERQKKEVPAACDAGHHQPGRAVRSGRRCNVGCGSRHGRAGSGRGVPQSTARDRGHVRQAAGRPGR